MLPHRRETNSIIIIAVAAAPVPTIHRVFGRTLFVGTNGIPDAAVVFIVSVAVPVVVLADKLIGPPTEHVGGSFPVNGARYKTARLSQ